MRFSMQRCLNTLALASLITLGVSHYRLVKHVGRQDKIILDLDKLSTMTGELVFQIVEEKRHQVLLGKWKNNPKKLAQFVTWTDGNEVIFYPQGYKPKNKKWKQINKYLKDANVGTNSSQYLGSKTERDKNSSGSEYSIDTEVNSGTGPSEIYRGIGGP